MDTQQKFQPNSKMSKPEKLPVTKRCQVILKRIPEEPENKQEQGSNNADKPLCLHFQSLCNDFINKDVKKNQQ